MKHVIIFLFFLFSTFNLNVWAQSERKLIRSGNENYSNKKFGQAENDYRKAIEKNQQSPQATFNLGDALYQQNKYEDAGKQFEQSIAKSKDKSEKSSAYHNLGNALLKQKKYDESINAYKQALKNNPNDDATRYNLAYAKKMIQQQQQQQNQQNKNEKNKDKNEKQNQQNKNENKDSKDKKDKEDKSENKDNKNKNEENKENKPNPNEMKKEDAERLLEALNKDEKELKEKLKEKQLKGVRIQIEKDW